MNQEITMEPLWMSNHEYTNPKPMFKPLLNRKKAPAIHISYIHPSTSKAKDAGASFFEGNPEWLLYRNYGKIIEANSRNHFEAQQSLNCEVEEIAYNELAEHCSVTGLIFHLIGHDFLTMDLQHDFSCYANTVRDIEFDGHFSYLTPAFQIISQLSSLKQVTFILGSKQMPFYLEANDKDYDDFIVPTNQNPISLSVKVDIQSYHTRSEKNRTIINNMIEVIFRRAGQSLLNLRHLDMKLPAVDESYLVLERVFHNCKEVKGEVFIDIEITPILKLVSCNCIIYAEDDKPSHSILADEVVPFPDLSESVNYQRDKDLLGAYENLKKAFHFLEKMPRSVSVPRTPNPAARVSIPPGFEYLYHPFRIASVQTQSNLTPRLRRSPTEIDELFMSISRNQEMVERNKHRIRFSRLMEGYMEYVGVGEPSISPAVIQTIIRWYDEISHGNR